MGQINELKDFTRGQLDAALMKIGQDAGMGTADGIRAFLANELTVSKPTRRFREKDGVIYLKDGVIYLSVVSDGTTGPEWIERLEGKDSRLGDYAKQLLLSKDFTPTKGVEYKVAILKGTFFSDEDRITKKIRAEANKRKWGKPNAEMACLIRENFSDEEIEAMGLIWVVVMHEPIKDSGGDPRLLGADRGGGGRWLGAYYGRPGRGWLRGGGFAFVSQVSA